jgi:hypothetical protein
VALTTSFQLVTGRVWRGSAFGGVKGRTELPGIVDGKSYPSDKKYSADDRLLEWYPLGRRVCHPPPDFGGYQQGFRRYAREYLVPPYPVEELD